MYFERFNVMFSGPSYFKNSILTMVDKQVLKTTQKCSFGFSDCKTSFLEEGAEESEGQAIGL